MRWRTRKLRKSLAEEASAFSRKKAITQPGSPDVSVRYDADGNQTRLKSSTGIWEVTYNAEDRPIAFTQGNKRIECKYDSLGRRVEKTSYTNGALTSRRRFAYQGYLMVAEYEAASGNNLLLHTYHWDRSSDIATKPLLLTRWIGTQKTRYAYLHTHNKNVCALVDANGNLVAEYDYDAFGNIIKESGSLASANPFRFSSEYFDADLGLMYYNFRHYNPVDGRWINREPLGEDESYNLYEFVWNNPPNSYDYAGLMPEWIDSVLDFFNNAFPANDGYRGYAPNGSMLPVQSYNPEPPPSPEEIEQLIDILSSAGVVDPTPISDSLAAALALYNGNYNDSCLIICGVIPIVGDSFKLLRVRKAGRSAEAISEAAKNLKKGMPKSSLGGSGKPKIHVVKHKSKKEARDAARNASNKNSPPMLHKQPTVGGPHYHATNASGKKISKKAHYQYRRKSSKNI